MGNTHEVEQNPQTTEERVRATLKRKLAKKRIKKILSWALFLGIIALGIYVYQYYKEHNALPFIAATRASAAQTAAAPVEMVVREIEYTQTVDISGAVEAYATQRVVFRSTGAVTGVFVQEGDTVNKGDLLATIDDTSQKYRVFNIESQIEQATFEGSQRQLELLNMQLVMEQTSLDYTRAYANFDGVVATVGVNVGDFAEAGTIVMILIDRSKLKATVEIDEIDIQSVTIGMPAQLTFDSVVGRTVDATVSYIPMIGRTTNQGIGVLDVEIVIEEPPLSIAPGFTFAGVLSSQETKKMLVVPTSAITSSRGVDTVRKKGPDGNPISVVVTTKYLGEGMSEILSGNIRANDVVFTSSSSSGSFSNFTIPGMTQPGANRMR